VSTPLQVYEPFRAGLPKLGKYWKSLWSRRTFISEYSKSELREQHFDSVFGQLWLVLNPLLLSGVYFILIVIIGGTTDGSRYVHLTASLFLFYLVANSLTGGVKSITAGQRLILNTAFPRIMLPISAVVIAIFKFVPTLIVCNHNFLHQCLLQRYRKLLAVSNENASLFISNLVRSICIKSKLEGARDC